MIVQITATKDECFLIKELLPIWQNYSDGFVFMVDKNTSDDTREYLQENKEKYNILEIIEHDWDSANPSERETFARQRLFDTAYKYSKKIICLDTDEYLDGTLTKKELEDILSTQINTVFLLQWIQYVNKNEIRVDGPWGNNFKDRVGSYSYNAQFFKKHNHSLHLPNLQKDSNDSQILFKSINPSQLFIAHLQWLDKKNVGLKQYYWKVCDYVQHKLHNVEIINCKDYDGSVNNFIWSTSPFNFPLKIKDDIYKTQNIKENTKLKYIKEQTQKHNIPNLGDWGMGIYDYAINLNLHSKKTKQKNISILLVTFKERFLYVKELINKIRLSSGDDFDILIAVNGNNEELMDENYRTNILELCKSTSRCYPFVCPEFKSLPKLWNTLVLFSQTEYNFILCDDVEYNNPETLNIIEKYISDTKEEFFTINGEFSFFVITKNMLHKLNYFDERLCGYGEEDGDITHSFILSQKRPLPVLKIKNIYNKALYDIKNKHIETHVDNKPRFNREFANLKYQPDPNGICGMNPTPISRKLEDKQQYPYEMFVKHNKHNIKSFNKIILKYDQ
jgi:hypothetical protein